MAYNRMMDLGENANHDYPIVDELGALVESGCRDIKAILALLEELKAEASSEAADYFSSMIICLEDDSYDDFVTTYHQWEEAVEDNICDPDAYDRGHFDFITSRI